jgi:hypothetical protein
MWFVSVALAAPGLHVRDLPESVPAGLGYDTVHERLTLDGERVGGSRRAQLEWLGEVFDDAPTLRIEERQQALRVRTAAAWTATGAGAAAFAVLALVPPLVVAVPVAAAGLAVEGTGVVVGFRAKRALDADDLARQVELLTSLEGGLASR